MATGRERVVINIEVNSDIATIEATRQALERLTRENRDLNDEYDRRRKTLRETQKVEKRTTQDHDAMGNALRRTGASAKLMQGRYKGMAKEIFAFRKDISKAIGAMGGFLKIINKLSIIEIPLLAAGMAGITLLFKSGTGFVNLYRAAMSSLSYAAAGAAVALTTVLAAQREFQSVQFAPMYFEGAVNTTDRFVAASQAMKMFVDNSALAVVGTESLSKAFGTLSKQAPVTGATTAAFQGLMNIVAGSGGDMGKGAEKLAEFLAKVQKSGIGAAGDVAKELGPDFEKVIKEAQGLGIKTNEEFFKAAAEGKLGETFATKYAGQLSAVNSTLFGQFKSFFTNIKSLLTDLGQEFLSPAKKALHDLQIIVERTVLQLSPMLRQFGEESFLGDVVSLVDRTAQKFVELMTRYLGTVPGVFGYIGSVFDKISNAFEKVQDWARQFVDAGQTIIDSFIKPIWEGLMDKFGGGMNYLADLVTANSGKIESFASKIVDLIAAIGEYGNFIKEAFVAALPLIEKAVEGVTMMFEALTKVGKFISSLGKFGGGMGKAISSAAALYATLLIATRFFQVLSQRFGKDMTIRANNVYVNGGKIPGTGMGTTFPGGGSYRGTPLQRAQSGIRSVGGKLSRFNQTYGFGNMALLAGGTALMGAGQSAGGTSTAGGAGLTGLGAAANLYAMGAMMDAGKLKVPKTTGLLGKLGGKGGALGASGLAAGAAIAGGSYAAGSFIGSKFSDDSIRSRGTAGLAGAASGALIGAAIGSFVPVIGTGVGAAVGAVVGGISAVVKSGKQRKEARSAANEFVSNYDEQIKSLIAAGDTEGLREAMAAFESEKVKNAAGDINYYNKVVSDNQAKIDALNKSATNFSANADLAQKYFGIGSDALNKLANEAGVNLQGKMFNLQEILKVVSKNADDAKRKLAVIFSGISGGLLTGILGEINKVEQEKELGASFNAAQQRVLTGDTSEEAYRNLIKQGLQYNVSQFGEFGGVAALMDTFKAENFAEGGAFYGMDKSRIDEMMRDFGITDTNISRRIGADGMESILAMLSGAGISGLTMSNLPALVDKLGYTGLANVEKALKDNPYSTNNAAVRGIVAGAGYQIGPTAPQPTSKSVAVTINATVLDSATIRKIREEVEKGLRDVEERGGSVYPPTTTRNGPR